ncbi:fimbrial biogenesis outer membrane usher protein [Enterobacter cloacae]|uniref:Fimbrial biogenesis outer membrane usher protein n=1 Tax=Enterobacter cloacae TaxID=550 RepID=A0A377M7I5_ENTCL|nr:fimbrial biogenesis outer membrane usher protein [Enterobacter cloacae]
MNVTGGLTLTTEGGAAHRSNARAAAAYWWIPQASTACP